MDFNIYILQSLRGGGYTLDKTIYAETWAKNMQGGRDCRILRYYAHSWDEVLLYSGKFSYISYAPSLMRN